MNFRHKGVPPLFPYNVPTLSSEGIHDVSNGALDVKEMESSSKIDLRDV
jgi:hypothetical protein